MCFVAFSFQSGIARPDAFFGPSDYWSQYSNVRCTGEEDTILACDRSFSNCYTDEDASVICDKGECMTFYCNPLEQRLPYACTL